MEGFVKLLLTIHRHRRYCKRGWKRFGGFDIVRIPLSFRGRPKPRGQKNAKIVFLALDNVRVRAIFSIVFYCNKLFNHFLLKNGESEVNMDSFLSVDGFGGLFGGLGSLFGGDYGYYDYGYNDYGYYADYDLTNFYIYVFFPEK